MNLAQSAIVAALGAALIVACVAGLVGVFWALGAAGVFLLAGVVVFYDRPPADDGKRRR